MFDDMVLKISTDIPETENEAAIYRYLSGKLPVPEVFAFETAGGKGYVLSSRIKGKMLCDESYLPAPDEIVSLAAEGLMLMWKLDVADCPVNGSTSTKLISARKNVEAGKITSLDDETKRRFSRPDDLLKWLEDNKPDEDLVFTHGDYCLPNIFADNGKISGFIDLGCAGVCDRYLDIALCLRSIEQNFSGKYRGGKDPIDYDPVKLIEKLGITPDHNKIKYYLYLDMLFS